MINANEIKYHDSCHVRKFFALGHSLLKAPPNFCNNATSSLLYPNHDRIFETVIRKNNTEVKKIKEDANLIEMITAS